MGGASTVNSARPAYTALSAEATNAADHSAVGAPDRTRSLVTHSVNGGTPAKASAPIVNAAPINRWRRPAPRNRSRSLLPSTVSHAPAVRNSRLLTAAWPARCAAPPTIEPAPAASTMNPTCAQVEAASSCFRSRCAHATAPSATAVAAPSQTAVSAPQPDSCSSGESRSSRYPPAATIVAECSSALTGLGPAMAPESQNENGSCADLPAAASSTPAVTASSHGPGSAASRSRSSDPEAAKAAPAARYKPKSPALVVMNAVVAPRTRHASRHQKPISAYEAAPMTSQAISNPSSVVAVTVASIAPAKISISPKNREAASSLPNSATE